MTHLSRLEQIRDFTIRMKKAVDRPTTDEKTLAFATGLIREEYKEFMEAIVEKDPAHVLKELCDLIYTAYGFAVAFGLPLEEALDRVHASNMSKLVDGKPLEREDGKLIKGPDYKPAVFDDLVEKLTPFANLPKKSEDADDLTEGWIKKSITA